MTLADEQHVPLRVHILHERDDAVTLLSDATAACRLEPSVLREPTYCSHDAAAHVILLTSFDYVDRFLPGHTFPILVLDFDATIERAVHAIKQGAFDYFDAATDTRQISASMRRAVKKVRHDAPLSEPPVLIGNNPKIHQVRRDIQAVADSNEHVLIAAPTGTETDQVAKSIHRFSQRNLMSLVSVNCAIHDKKTLGQMLYGKSPRLPGLIEKAKNSTIFLDQVPSLTERQFSKFFVHADEHDVRVIASISPENPNRRDPSYLEHFSTKVIELPALRERTEDIELLAEALVLRHAKVPLEFSESSLNALHAYSWPSNVRELENVIERAVLLTKAPVIEPTALAIEATTSDLYDRSSLTVDHSLEKYFINFVRTHEKYLSETEIASRLGISRKSLWQRRQRHGMPRKFSKV